MATSALTVTFGGLINFTASYPPAQRIITLNSSNPNYLRYALLTNDSLQIVYYTSSATIPLDSLYTAAFASNPALTYPPVILVNPISSTVTHPSPAYFSVTATAETPITYQWYWQSASLSSYVPCPISLFAGTASAALTCSATVIATENSASFYCSASNISGITTSSAANLYVL